MLYSLVCARYTPIPLAHDQVIHHAYIGTYSQVTNGISLVMSTVPRFVAMSHIATVPDNMMQYHTLYFAWSPQDVNPEGVTTCSSQYVNLSNSSLRRGCGSNLVNRSLKFVLVPSLATLTVPAATASRHR